MERVTCKEREVTLLEDFNLQIFAGEILGLLPVNAHGMAAFLKLLQTNGPLYDGYVYYGGEMVNSWKGTRKSTNRISVIGVESRLVENMSVSDNIFVLRQGFRQEIIRTKLLKHQLAPFLEDIDMDISVDARVEDLPVFERVVVELLRAVAMGNRLIVLNEIGTVISAEELGKLHEILRHYTKQGFSFLYICLHYEEMDRICDRTAMLSNGRIQKIVGRGAEEQTLLYAAEYDRMVRSHLENRKEVPEEKEEVLRFHHLQGESMRDLTFSVYKAECLVLQIQDNGLFREMRDMLLGNLQPESGEILMDGKRAALTGDGEIAVVQELPTKTMVFPKLSYMENLCISLSNRVPDLWRNRRIRSSIRQEYGEVLGEEVFFLSEENLSERQKYQMIYMRVLLQKPRIVFCIQPFKGADLPHRMVVWEMMEMLLEHGIAVVILSLNLADSLSLADRLLIIDSSGRQKEMMRSDFASIPTVEPWIHLYRN
ncbi:MAG: sugar ABC transporter ATP-binding protein [Lachnospiraceae bacterium]|nr:sugar ABC transporter ATP-binding protein [Lachnospiraceae bacterium]